MIFTSKCRQLCGYLLNRRATEQLPDFIMKVEKICRKEEDSNGQYLKNESFAGVL